MTGDYTAQATAAVLAAARADTDVAAWLAGVLADVAARLGSSDALLAERPGSWEAGLVGQLVRGTVGYDDEALPPLPAGRKLTDAQAREIRWRFGEIPDRELAAEFGVSASTVRDIGYRRTWGWLT
jgi:hypothetical protein